MARCRLPPPPLVSLRSRARAWYRDRDGPGRRRPNPCSCLSTKPCLTASDPHLCRHTHTHTHTHAHTHHSTQFPPSVKERVICSSGMLLRFVLAHQDNSNGLITLFLNRSYFSSLALSVQTRRAVPSSCVSLTCPCSSGPDAEESDGGASDGASTGRTLCFLDCRW